MSVGGWLVGTVSAAEKVTPTGRVLSVEVPGWPGNLPGQHLDLRLTAEDGYQAVRSYSVASSGPGTTVELAVDELPDGEVSPYLVQDVLPGDDLEVRGPLGGFFVWRESDPDPVQLVAGGSGIVPLIAMARAHRRSGSAASFRLLYSVRSPDDAYYARELEALVDERFQLDWAYTRRVPEGSGLPVGRVTSSVLATTTLPPETGPAVFVCGPTGFVEAVAAALVQLGHDPQRIRTERFGGN